MISATYFVLRGGYYKLAAAIHSYMQETTPKSAIPAVQIPRAILVAWSLWNVGSGLSVFVIYIAFTMSR